MRFRRDVVDKSWIHAIVALSGWLGSISLAMSAHRISEMWLAFLFMLATLVVLAQRESPSRFAAVSGSMYGGLILVLCIYLGGRVQEATTRAAESGGSEVLLIPVQIALQGLLASALVGWFFRSGILLIAGLAYAVAPTRLGPVLSGLSQWHPSWWWQVPVVMAVVFLGLAAVAYVALRWASY